MKSNKLGEKLINWLLNILIVIFGIILLISLYITVQTKVLKNDYANFFGYSIFEVQTGSMATTINAGDWIIVGLDKNIKINDIITYELNGEYITHRVVESYKGTYVTMGDANNAKDERITSDQVIGKVVNILPKLGILRKTLFNPAVLIAIIITLLLCSIAFDKKKSKKLHIKKVFGSNAKENIVPNVTELNNSEITNKVKDIFNKDNTDDVKDNTEVNNIDDTKKYDLSDISDEYKEDDAEKTIFYRNIAVDASELEEENNVPEEVEVVKEIPIKKEETNIELDVDDDSITDINLDLLEENKSSKKGKNIIDRVMIIKEEELDEILTAIDSSEPLVNEPTIKTIFTNAYLDIKYYNQYEDNESNKKLFNRVEILIKRIAKKLITTYTGSDNKYAEKVKKYASMFILIADLEDFSNMENVSEIRESFKESLNEYAKRDNKDWNEDVINSIIQKIIKIKRNYVGIIEYFFKKFDTNMFKLNCDKLDAKKNLFAVKLEHNITFGKVYSEYIIDKTYTEGIIAEDKLSILLTLLSLELVKDMLSSNFENKYMFYISNSLYKKPKKYEKLLKMIDDEYAKNNVLILLTYEELKANKKMIKKIKGMGYKFALTFTKENIIKDEEIDVLFMADYIFIDKKKMNTSNMFSYFPEGLSEKIVYENIIDKIDDYGSE